MSTIYTFNNKVLKNSANDKWLTKKEGDPYNPLGLQDGVMRMKVQDGWTPSGYDTSSLEFTQVSSTPNIWDMKVKKGEGIGNWGISNAGIIEVMGFNPEGITGYTNGLKFILSEASSKIGAMKLSEITIFTNKMKSTLEEFGPISLPNATDLGSLFSGVSNLRYVKLTDLNNLEDCSSMFRSCTSLTSMPILIGIESLTEVNEMFANCTNIETGVLDMYNRLSNMSSITKHEYCFANCGRDTTTGAAELAQIPLSWGGTGA